MTEIGMNNFLNDIQHHVVDVPEGYESAELTAWIIGYNDAIERVLLLYKQHTEGQKE